MYLTRLSATLMIGLVLYCGPVFAQRSGPQLIESQYESVLINGFTQARTRLDEIR